MPIQIESNWLIIHLLIFLKAYRGVCESNTAYWLVITLMNYWWILQIQVKLGIKIKIKITILLFFLHYSCLLLWFWWQEDNQRGKWWVDHGLERLHWWQHGVLGWTQGGGGKSKGLLLIMNFQMNFIKRTTRKRALRAEKRIWLT